MAQIIYLDRFRRQRQRTRGATAATGATVATVATVDYAARNRNAHLGQSAPHELHGERQPGPASNATGPSMHSGAGFAADQHRLRGLAHRPAHQGLRSSDTVRSRDAQIPVSVVVPTCGRPQLLNQCLAALCAQRFPPARFEIIVVDDQPDPATRHLVDHWAERVAASGTSVTYVANTGPHGPAAARNRGWKAARGSIIAFTDDDTIPSADWLLNGMRAFADDVEAVWGRIVMPLEGTPTDYERDAKGLEVAEFVTANCFCPRYVLQEIGGFDERFRFAWREDADLYFRLLQRDGRIVHAPSAVVVHPIRPAGWGVSLRQQKKVLFDALLYKKHPQLYRQKIRPHPRYDYYLIVLALLVSVGAGLLGQLPLTLGAAAVWMFFTARFCIARLHQTRKSASHVAEMVVTSALIPPTAVFWRLVGALRFRAALL